MSYIIRYVRKSVCASLRQRHEDAEQIVVYGRAQARDGIPAGDGGEAVGAAAWVATRRDLVHMSARCSFTQHIGVDLRQ